MTRPARAAAVVVAVVALALALAGCGGAPAARIPHSEFSPYVALGDSYTAAPLIPVQSTDGCFRSSHNYPSLVADKMGIPLFEDRSCGGAQTKDMTTSQKPGIDPQFDALTRRTKLVTIGIGGNDLGIAQTLFAGCPSVSNQDPQGAPCRTAMQQGGKDKLLSAMPSVTQRVTEVLRQIHQRSPQARVLVVGYPQIVPAQGTCKDRLPLGDGDYPYFRRVIQALNDAVHAAAEATHDTWIDVWSASAGHDVCSSDPWINGGATKPGKAAPLHPFVAEQEAVAKLIESALSTST